jgi:prevent-host-death family protein
MNSTWQVQEAKNRFSELIDETLRNGPQVVTRHGKPLVRIVPFETPAKIGTRGKQQTGASLVELLMQCPVEFELPPRRSRDYARDVDFA